jgi:hypothetical protein
MNNIFKIALLIATLNISAFAENDSIAAAIDAGYTSSYLVNNLVQAKDAAVAGVTLGKTYAGVDFSLKGQYLPIASGTDSSHWGIGLGKSFKAMEELTIRTEAGVTRHQTGQALIQNYTEVNARVALENKFFVPYVKGIYNVELEQSGATVGMEKRFSLYEFNFTPAVEYTLLTDAKTYAAKLAISRNIWKNLDAFTEVAYIKNDFSTSNINFALKEFDGLVGTGGLRWTF